MNRSRLFGHVTLAAYALLAIASSVFADTQPVRVTNTNANPVPVNGNVVVSGTANVNVTNPVTIQNPVTAVTVGNGTAHPVPVLEAKTPLQLLFKSLLAHPYGDDTVNSYPMTATVPAGQMWVIEHITLNFLATAAPGDNAIVYLDTPQIRDSIPMVQHAMFGMYYYDTSVQTKVYVMPGEALSLNVIVGCSPQPNNEGITAAIMGYRITYP